MSRIVAGLQRSGLVRRHATEDGRRVRLEATPKGVSLMWEARKRRVESLAKALTGFPKTRDSSSAKLSLCSSKSCEISSNSPCPSFFQRESKRRWFDQAIDLGGLRIRLRGREFRVLDAVAENEAAGERFNRVLILAGTKSAVSPGENGAAISISESSGYCCKL